MSTASPDDLTLQQSTFCSELVLDPQSNATRAAIRAGYTPKHAKKSASRLLSRPDVQRRIEHLKARSQLQFDYTIEQWRKDLLEDIETAKAAGSHSAVMKGRELLGRHIGAMSDPGRLGDEEKAFYASLGAVMMAAFNSQQAHDGQPVTIAVDQVGKGLPQVYRQGT